MDITDPLTAGTSPVPEPVELSSPTTNHSSPPNPDDSITPPQSKKRSDSLTQPEQVAEDAGAEDSASRVGGNDSLPPPGSSGPTEAAVDKDESGATEDQASGGQVDQSGVVDQDDVLDVALKSALSNPRDRLLLLRVEIQLQAFLAAKS